MTTPRPQTTATISIGRDDNAEYRHAGTYPPDHAEVAALIRARANAWRNVTILAVADGIGEYDGQTEPCTIALVTGDADQVDNLAEDLATCAREYWAQECIGYVWQRVAHYSNTLAYPGDVLPSAAFHEATYSRPVR